MSKLLSGLLPKKSIKETPELKALRILRAEARAHGVVLTHNGEGGLPNSLVLGIMRRDEYKCKVHGDRGEGDFGGLQVHHKGGLRSPTSLWLEKKAHRNDRNNIVTVCAKGHDAIHELDNERAENEDEP